MPSPTRPLLALTAAGLLSVALTGCGGSSGSSTADEATSDSPSASTSATPSPTVDPQSTGIEAQAIGLDVAAWSNDHDLTFPKDEAEFESGVKYQHSLTEGNKVAYRKTAEKDFQVCVVSYDGSTPTSWGIYQASSGAYTSGAGAPKEQFCP